MSGEVASPRIADALDEAVERMLTVLLKWGEDSRGPGNSWTKGIAETVAILVDARVTLRSLDSEGGGSEVSDG